MNPIRILWVNPSFLDYRIPFYKSLHEFCNGNFYLAYSKSRVPERCINKITNSLGENALCLEKEKHISFNNAKSDFSCASISIPYPSGLSRLLSSVNADIIIGEGFFQWTPWALKYSLSKKIPLLLAYERTAHTERNCPSWRTMYRRLINKFVSGYLVNGSLCRQYLQEQIRTQDKMIIEGIMAADSECLSNKCEKFRKTISRGKSKYGITYIYVGRLIKLKGVEYLLKAWKKHSWHFPQDILLIIGDGPERESLQNFAEESVIFYGKIDYEYIHEYYAQADVFIIPTLEDNWSLVVPEAMACSLPIGCSCYNGCHPELIENGENGYIFDPMIEESIIKMLQYFHGVDLKEMGAKSKFIENNFSPIRCAERAYEGIQKIVNKIYIR